MISKLCEDQNVNRTAVIRHVITLVDHNIIHINKLIFNGEYGMVGKNINNNWTSIAKINLNDFQSSTNLISKSDYNDFNK